MRGATMTDACLPCTPLPLPECRNLPPGYVRNVVVLPQSSHQAPIFEPFTLFMPLITLVMGPITPSPPRKVVLESPLRDIAII